MQTDGLALDVFFLFFSKMFSILFICNGTMKKE